MTEVKPNFMHYSTTADDASANNLLVYAGQRFGSILRDEPPATLSRLIRPAFRFPGSGVPTPGSTRTEPNGFYSYGSGSVFATQCDPAYPLSAKTTLTPMDTCFTVPVGQNNGVVTCGTNESLTGSIVLTNDSASVTDGTVSANGISLLSPAQHADYPISRLHSEQFQPHVSLVEEPSKGKLDAPHLTGGIEMNGTRSTSMHITQPLPLRPSSQESLDYGDSTRQLTQVRSTLTPLIVRFPSGEAGLLVSSPREPSGTSGSGSESLNRCALGYSRSNRQPHRIPLGLEGIIVTTHASYIQSTECNPALSKVQISNRRHCEGNLLAANPTIQLTRQVICTQEPICGHGASSVTSPEQASSESVCGAHRLTAVAGTRRVSNASPDYVFLPAHKTELLITGP